MIRKATSLIVYVNVLSCCLWALPAVAVTPTVLQKKPPLTLNQIEMLIKGTAIAKPTPDLIIARAIMERSVEFLIDAKVLQHLEQIGAGPQTIRVLRSLPSQPIQSGTTTILIADFKGLDGEDIGLTDTLTQRLSDAVSDYRDVRVLNLGETITASRGGRDAALDKGRARNSNIVLWGWFLRSPEKILVTVNFEVLKTSATMNLSSERGSYHAALSTLNEFTLQGELSKELTTIILVATALTRIDVGDYWAAIKRLNEALESRISPQMVLGSDEIFFYSCLAYILVAVEDMENVRFLPGVIANLESYRKKNRESPVPDLLLSLAHFLSKNFDKATECAQRLEESSDLTLKRAAYSMLMNLAEVSEDQPKAKEYAEKLITSFRNKELTASDYISIAEAQTLLKLDSDALRSLESALKGGNDARTLARIHLIKGRIYYENSSTFEDALSEFRHVSELNPRIFEPHFKMGDISYWRKQYSVAVQHYTRAIKLVPKAEAYSNRANAFMGLEKTKAALDDYDKAISVDPNYGPAYVGRGLLYLDYKNEPDKALFDFDKGLKLEPRNRDALYARAEIYSDRGNFDASIADYNAIIQINPNDAAAFFYRGVVNKYKGAGDNALADFSTAIKLDPNYVPVYLERSLAYISKGDFDSAKKDLRKVLQLTKEPHFRRLANERLRQLSNRKRVGKESGLKESATRLLCVNGDFETNTFRMIQERHPTTLITRSAVLVS